MGSVALFDLNIGNKKPRNMTLERDTSAACKSGVLGTIFAASAKGHCIRTGARVSEVPAIFFASVAAADFGVGAHGRGGASMK